MEKMMAISSEPIDRVKKKREYSLRATTTIAMPVSVHPTAR